MFAPLKQAGLWWWPMTRGALILLSKARSSRGRMHALLSLLASASAWYVPASLWDTLPAQSEA